MKKQPNIVLIMTDQLRWDCLGYAGHPDVKTPYLDAIINVLSLYLDEDFMAEGPDFEEIDVATLL